MALRAIWSLFAPGREFGNQILNAGRSPYEVCVIMTSLFEKFGLLPVMYYLVSISIFLAQRVWTEWPWFTLIPSIIGYFVIVRLTRLVLRENVHWKYIALWLTSFLFVTYITVSGSFSAGHLVSSWSNNGWHWFYCGIQMGNIIADCVLITLLLMHIFGLDVFLRSGARRWTVFPPYTRV